MLNYSTDPTVLKIQISMSRWTLGEIIFENMHNILLVFLLLFDLKTLPDMMASWVWVSHTI